MKVKNRGAEYGTALDRTNKAELEMRRAFNRWEKYRLALKRCERRLDDAMRADEKGNA